VNALLRTFSALAPLAAVLAVVAPQSAAAQTATSSALAPATPPATAEDLWLVSLTALLADRYHTTGELRLSWIRARPAGTPADADLVLVSAPSELASQLLVTVRATDAAGRAAEHTLVLRAELWRDGLALRDAAPTGAPLDPASADIRRFDALRERDALPLNAVNEMAFARAVPAGRLLTRRDVIRFPLVRRGQTIEVLATDGRLTVTLRAIALNDAGRGETVRVRNPDSKKDFVAEVIADSRATIRF
jgi:flagella basal body P-ring formation protein FlgA